MRNIYCSFISHHVIKMGIDFIFRQGVQCSRGFVQNHKGSILVQRSGQCDFLGLTSGHRNPALIKVLIQIGVETFGKQGEPFLKTCLLQALPGFVAIIISAGGHVFAQGKGQQLKVLEYHGKQGHIFVVIVLLNIDAVEQNFSFRGIVQAA